MVSTDFGWWKYRNLYHPYGYYMLSTDVGWWKNRILYHPSGYHVPTMDWGCFKNFRIYLVNINHPVRHLVNGLMFIRIHLHKAICGYLESRMSHIEVNTFKYERIECDEIANWVYAMHFLTEFNSRDWQHQFTEVLVYWKYYKLLYPHL